MWVQHKAGKSNLQNRKLKSFSLFFHIHLLVCTKIFSYIPSVCFADHRNDVGREHCFSATGSHFSYFIILIVGDPESRWSETQRFFQLHLMALYHASRYTHAKARARKPAPRGSNISKGVFLHSNPIASQIPVSPQRLSFR